jgi:hypothetical protein
MGFRLRSTAAEMRAVIRRFLARGDRPTWAATRISITASAARAWDNRASRCCLIAAAASLWLALALADPIFLITLLASVAGLWVLHHRNHPPTTDPDEWL